jgi:hypothetical protein
MTDDQYIEVCRLTDEILQSQSASSTRVAIPWLHVLRRHHIFLQEYENIYDDTIIGYFKNFKRKVLNVISLFVVLAQSLFYSRYSQWLQSFNRHSKKDILFVSHLLKKSQYSQGDDSYFFDLPQKISDAGFKSLVVMINHTGRELIGSNDNNEKNLKKIVLPRRLGFYDEMKNVGLLWTESKTLTKEMRLEKNKIKKKFLYFAKIESLSPSSLTSLRLAIQIGGLVKTLGPKSLITTHEGYAWERKVYEAVRQVDQDIKCIGYTHAPIFENQHAIKRSLAKQFNPDVILVSGPTQKKQLEKYGLLKNIQIDVLGSLRFIQRKVDNADLQIKKKIAGKSKQFCLVIPEGIKKEIDLLFDFSLECAKAIPECQFIWRLHPIFASIKLKYGNLPDNIIISDQKLKHDLLKSQWVLYRASSVVIQAVVAGLKPIYLHRADEIKIDPIYEIENWKSEVQSVQEFESTVMQTKGDYSDYQQALKYCKDVYSPLNEKILIENIRKNNL